jgi:hypothetical protein
MLTILIVFLSAQRQESGSKQTLVASTYDTTVATHSESIAPQAHQLVKKVLSAL